LEAGYRPDGWLGPLCINNLYYDCSTPEKIEAHWNKISERLQTEIDNSGERIDGGLPTICTLLVVRKSG